MKLPRFILVACLALSAGWAVQAQQPTPAAPVLRKGVYDKTTEVIVSGTIQSIQAQTGSLTMPRGTYLVLQSSALTWNVHMGLLVTRSIPFKTGDAVAVTGSVITVNGMQILLARRVQSANQTLVVRSSNGFVLRARPAGQTQGGLQ